jgi:hypothetical protein
VDRGNSGDAPQCHPNAHTTGPPHVLADHQHTISWSGVIAWSSGACGSAEMLGVGGAVVWCGRVVVWSFGGARHPTHSTSPFSGSSTDHITPPRRNSSALPLPHSNAITSRTYPLQGHPNIPSGHLANWCHHFLFFLISMDSLLSSLLLIKGIKILLIFLSSIRH